MRTSVYVDGFNLYYGCLKGTPHRWLDLAALCRVMLPRHTIHRLRYFTARVQARPGDPNLPVRQQTYLRALRTIPNLTIHEGQFLTHQVLATLAVPLPNGTRTVRVWKTEEKGSDVNLASYLLADGFQGDYEVAVVISGDSDLTTPIEMVRSVLNLPVGVLNPYPRPSRELSRVATFYKTIRQGSLRVSQLPGVLHDEQGAITKPVGW